jgi:outer membrane protein OmpA-like peptidoglycan-associated protein
MPVNLGRGINSTADDFGIVFKKLDKEGYFSSNRNQCNDDIFSFNFIESTVPPSDSIKVDRNVADTSILPVEKATLNYSSDSILSDSVIDKKWVVVYYAFNQSALSKNAKLSLDSLVERIKNHSHVKVILGSFADPVGDPNYNLLLSQKRAQAVLNYLHQKGINKSNIIAQYFGSKYLVSKKPKLAKKNRRTEIMLTYQQNTNWLLLHKSTKPLLINKSKR